MKVIRKNTKKNEKMRRFTVVSNQYYLVFEMLTEVF